MLNKQLIAYLLTGSDLKIGLQHFLQADFFLFFYYFFCYIVQWILYIGTKSYFALPFNEVKDYEKKNADH